MTIEEQVEMKETNGLGVVDSGSGFDFDNCSEGMDILMRRLYAIKTDCGDHGISGKEMDAKKKELRNIYLKVDDFEKIKAQFSGCKDRLKNYLDEFSNNPKDKNLEKLVEDTFKEMNNYKANVFKLHADFMNKRGKWEQIPNITTEFQKERVEQYKAFIKEFSLMKDAYHEFKRQARTKRNKSNMMSVDDFLKKKQPLDDEKMPLKIEEGLKQLKEIREKQEESLDQLLVNVEKIIEQAKGMGSEIDVQTKQLGKIDTKVQKASKDLDRLNRDLDTQIQAVGQSTKFIIIGVAIIVVLIVILLIFLVLKTYLKF